MKVLSKAEVVELLKKQQGKRRQKEFAAYLGISPAYLCDVYQGRRDPGPAILDHLNLTWAYVRKA
jgi:transcriptional regulator with XRE-family HTH domain